MVRVTLLANAGVLVEYQGTTLLLDSIYGREPHYFSDLKPGVWEQMLRGEPPFAHIDYLLFTHCHPDHFSPEMTMEFLRARPVKGIFLPDAPMVRESGLEAFLTRRKIPFAYLPQVGNCSVEQGISIRGLSTRHLDKKFQDVEHLCYLLTFGAKHLLFTADVDYTQERFTSIADLPLRAVFVNPLFFSALRHGRFFDGNLNTQLTCVYHVPFAGDDPMNMRLPLARDLSEWPGEKGEALVLDEPFMQVKL